MRYYLAGAFVLLSALAASAQPAAPAPPAQQFDVPATAPQMVAILTRDFAPGQPRRPSWATRPAAQRRHSLDQGGLHQRSSRNPRRVQISRWPIAVL